MTASALPAARHVRVSLAALVVGAACAAPTPPPARAPEPALVSVEVVRGLGMASAPEERVGVVIDASRSMEAPVAAGVTRFAAARERATALLRSLPPGTLVAVEGVGTERGSSCAPSSPVAPPGSSPEASAAAVGALEPGGQGSLADGIRAVLARLTARGGAEGARVVAFGDLSDACDGDLCAAASAVAEAGASLDLVILGEAPTPACVTSVPPPTGAPSGLAPLAPVRFRVSPAQGAPVDGQAGGDAVSATPGAARLEVALDPPLEVGPVTLAPGAIVRLRVMDFPGERPPVREWSLDVVDEGGTLAASPGLAEPARP